MTRQSSAHNEDSGTASTSAVPHVAPRVVVGGGTDCDGHTSNVSVTLIFSRLKDFVLTKGAHACRGESIVCGGHLCGFVLAAFAHETGEEREKGGRRQVVREAIEELMAADKLAHEHRSLMEPSASLKVRLALVAPRRPLHVLAGCVLQAVALSGGWWLRRSGVLRS